MTEQHTPAVTERAAFDEWFKRHRDEWDERGRQLTAWDGWQARAALSAPEAREAVQAEPMELIGWQCQGNDEGWFPVRPETLDYLREKGFNLRPIYAARAALASDRKGDAE